MRGVSDREPARAANVRESWRLIVTWGGEPGWNMALDEALLAGHDLRPVLRFYTWEPEALSLGYFQPWAELAPRAGANVLVRRFSGGGAIHHADELTFSIAASQRHPLFAGEVRSSYERIHALLAAAFTRFGVHAELRGAHALGSDRSATGMCFHASTPLDLAWDGKKGVGSAQRRSGGRVLHHGSIKLGASALEEGVARLRSHAPALEPAELAHAIQGEFERGLGCAFAAEEPSVEEREHAARRAAFFRSEAFVRRR